jgi:predicted ester cyclase
MPMGIEENKVLARRIIEEFINMNQPSVADEIFADDFINHSPQFNTTPDLAGLKQFISQFHQGFEDYHLTIEDLIAEKDKVVGFVRNTGTHTGEVLGIPPTHKHVDFYSISILRIAGGKVKERWNITNEMEVMRQLGLM